VVALLLANVTGDSYRAVWDAETALGPGWLHLDLTLGDWAADGLLALFFFIAGIGGQARAHSR
jgi:NhaA family Na+:H+ antiporter